MIVTSGEAARAERAAALANAEVVGPLARLNPGSSPTTFPMAGGRVVLLGPGMYVNRGLALAFDVEATAEDLDSLEAASRVAGVPAEAEVSPLAHPSLLGAAASRGYRPAGFRSTLLRHLGPEAAPATGIVDVEEVYDAPGVARWQATAAEGFGFTTDEQRRISDRFTAAISETEQTRLYLARRAGREVATASLAMSDGVAVLGGMTTVPSARGLGIQGELIRFRLGIAGRAGCDTAMATASPGGTSERNLLRAGFSLAYTTLTVRLAP